MKKRHLDGSAQSQTEIEVCPICFGCGMEVVKDKGARLCICRKQKIIAEWRDKTLPTIPARFAGVSLETLEPNLARHPKQAEAIKRILANPNSNFCICGDFGSGKTHLFYAIFRSMLEKKRAFAGTLEEIIGEHKAKFEADKAGKPSKAFSVTPEMLSNKQIPFGLFIDDIDKETPTEFVCKILFALVNAAYDNFQQIVFTTNLKPQELIQHFEKADPRFGGAISRRLMDNAKVIKLF